jgi:rRNA maturation endonuclease Nob1
MKTEKTCELCGSPVARISLSARSKLIDFYICSKKGCRWHGLSEDDINEIKLEDSLEW